MSDPAAVRATVYIEAELHHALRLRSAHASRSMSQIVNDALREALREDQHDLALARTRKREKPLGYEQFLDKLRADGTL